jgi:hypothetical protein
MKLVNVILEDDGCDIYGVARVDLTEAEIRSLDQDVALQMAHAGTTINEAEDLLARHNDYMKALLAIGRLKSGRT